MHTTSRILIAIVITLLISNVVTAVGWGMAAGKIPHIGGLSALAGPNTEAPEAAAAPEPKKDAKAAAPKKPAGPDEDTDDDDDDADSGGFMDSVDNAFSNLKSAVML